MGIPQVFLLAQACFYLLLFVLSFFVCVPAGVNVDDFKGHCLLYATGKWNFTNTDTELQKVDWGPDSACNFTIFIGVMSLLVSLIYIIWIGVLLARGIESSWIDAFLNLTINSITCICVFSSGLSVSVGFQDWCKLVTDPKSGIDSCENGQYIQIGSKIDVDADSFYLQWQMVQFGLWSCWICWLVLSVMALIRIYRYHRRESFYTSINREKQRLLAHVGKAPEQA
ncbi:transmembrane protein 179-like [Biomphalaria glabrata]|uniref:Transmembrane protein 179-like n=1 Tax=Biomphalaria glabrata TaxID=6526 RepID=A0A2C9LN99_BIOGL|nr:transmembrane protein 179-like [Biomphalaria glabrata]XP_055879979.1 transmembrane protein 179-like [Biomphalaria glabrata]XP_055879980.1 transmembrane protein 179-like [Biomphalaria glabrata]